MDEKAGSKRKRTSDDDTAAATGTNSSSTTTSTNVSKKKNREELKMRKRIPQRLPTLEHDIYVASSSNFMAQCRRAEKLLNQGRPFVVIHGLGKMVQRAVELALKLERDSLGLLELTTTTSTVPLVDDLDPIDQDEIPSVQERLNSAIHITIRKRTTASSRANL